MNTFGTKLRLTTFGESHGPAIGGIIDGFPSGFKIDFESLQKEVSKRSPGSSNLVTQRKEKDIPEFLSGISPQGITLGTPIGFIIRNCDNHSSDYSDLADKYRPNHADYTYEAKYGLRDYRGGGRASARETANWVVAGALAQQWLHGEGINIKTLLTSVGQISFTDEIIASLSEKPFSNQAFEIPSNLQSDMDKEILKAKNEGDSVGGIVTCLINGLNAGYGNPVFDKLHSRLAQAMMSINAAKGFEYGYGFNSSFKKGSLLLDTFTFNGEIIETKTNFSGGIQGGISNGMPIFFNVAFKPTPTILREIETVDINGNPTILKMKGRHDPCVAVRGVSIVKALAALVIADFLL